MTKNGPVRLECGYYWWEFNEYRSGDMCHEYRVDFLITKEYRLTGVEGEAYHRNRS